MRVSDWVWYRPNPAKWLLWPLGGVYGAVMAVRRCLYRRGIKAVTTMPLPVIVVGNLTVGGTGKTPLVIWLAGQLRALDYRVGIVSRGHGGTAGAWPQRVRANSDPALVGDEPVLLARATACPVMVGPDRVAAASALIAAEPLDVVLADDGLQHYALGRNLEIVVVDGERGLGNGLCLPAGPLRERKRRSAQADAVVVNGGSWGHSGVFRAQPVAQRLHQVAGSAQASLEAFAGTPVHAVAGIGNPQRFFDLLAAAGVDVLPHPLPDHARLSRADLQFDDSHPVFVTEKDAVKCEPFARRNVWCVPIKLVFSAEDGERLMCRVLREL